MLVSQRDFLLRNMGVIEQALLFERSGRKVGQSGIQIRDSVFGDNSRAKRRALKRT